MNHKNIINRLSYLVEDFFSDGIFQNVFAAKSKKRALLLYLKQPFTRFQLSTFPPHQSHIHIRIIAEELNNLGFEIDIADYNTQRLNTNKRYDLVVDIHPREHPVYEKNVDSNTLKIAFITGANPRFSNSAERIRLDSFNMRHHKKLRARRQVDTFPKLIENFSAIFMIGNQMTLNTYSEFNFKKVFLLENTGLPSNLRAEKTSFNPKRFLFIGGFGQIHKGADLLLDVFAQIPECTLGVCGSYQKEADFYSFYESNIHKHANFNLHGFIDFGKKTHRELVQSYTYIVLPSCSEGLPGSTLNAMSLGLIPVTSTACNLPPEDSNIIPNISIPGINKLVKKLSKKDSDWLKKESKKSIRLAEDKYSENKFRQRIREALESMIPTN